MQPKMLLVFFATRAACWLIFHLSTHQDPQVLASQAVSPLLVLMSPDHRYICPQVQDIAFPLLEIPVSPFLQPAEVPLNGGTTPPNTHTFFIICKQDRIDSVPQFRSLVKIFIRIDFNIDVRYPAGHQPPGGLCVSGHNPLKPAVSVQLTFHLSGQTLSVCLWECHGRAPKPLFKLR